ncbi:hypothetical protein ACK9YZ_01305 [Rhizobium sp. ZK1]|uniref:hypothetical protein n=1 Tax=Rhizobium sp. ZK1 TaxID=3389872 RepID=UPI0039F64BED
MLVRVVIPPSPIVLPEDIAGVDAGDTFVEAMIAAVTGELDGPDGWLGRCLGEQTLEVALDCWPCAPLRLPYPPFIEVEEVRYFSQGGTEELLADGDFQSSNGLFWLLDGFSMPSLASRPDPIVIRYRAGYDENAVDEGGTGKVPAQVRQAIILSVQHLRSLGKDDLFLRAEEVEGVGRTEYTVSEQAGNIIRQASDRLLSGLRIYA